MRQDDSGCADDELAAAVLGDRDAFDQLVAEHRDRIYRFCGKFLYNEADREDAVQQVFIRAWKYLPRFRGECTFATWLCRIAVNVCSDIGRHLQTEAALVVQTLEDTVDSVSRGPSIEDQEIGRQMIEAVRRELGELDATMFGLHYGAGMSKEDIASRLGLSSSGVRTRFKRKILPVIERVRRDFL